MYRHIKIFLVVLLVGLASAWFVDNRVDYITQVKNKLDVDVREFNFAPVQPGGSLTSGITNTVTIPLAPVGFGAGYSGYQVYITGGTGTAEAVTITGGTCVPGLTGCTIQFTPANNHSGSFVIESATQGIWEAINYAAAGSTIRLPNGIYRVYTTIPVSKQLNFVGDSFASTTVVQQTDNIGVFHVLTSMVNFRDFQIQAANQQTSAGYGINIDATSGDSFGTNITRMKFYQLYVGVLGTNADQYEVADSLFFQFAYRGISTADAATPDNGGPLIHNCHFDNNGLGSPADSAIYVANTGAIVISDNNVNGSANQVNKAIFSDATQSSGLIIANNDIENLGLYSIHLRGTYSRISINGNVISQFGGIGDPSTWIGILIDGADGKGAITTNVLQGDGVSPGNTLIQFFNGAGDPADWNVSSNELDDAGLGFFVVNTASAILLASNNLHNVTSPFTINSTNVSLQGGSAINYAQLPTAANGSFVPCANCNASCTNGDSSAAGTMCHRVNGVWTN